MRRKVAMQVAIYDLGNNPLPEKVIREVEDAVQKIVQKHTTIAHLVVAE